ncbi:hypothetical protein [Taibaiella koreensis]|uniref:hypothetical protein n=1 Tax=Taibaiella koreensis TaxID=1268548 RepID=UPI000E59E555|nr:hypothetical protein [Taibaiella koreensis]
MKYLFFFCFVLISKAHAKEPNLRDTGSMRIVLEANQPETDINDAYDNVSFTITFKNGSYDTFYLPHVPFVTYASEPVLLSDIFFKTWYFADSIRDFVEYNDYCAHVDYVEGFQDDRYLPVYPQTKTSMDHLKPFSINCIRYPGKYKLQAFYRTTGKRGTILVPSNFCYIQLTGKMAPDFQHQHLGLIMTIPPGD